MSKRFPTLKINKQQPLDDILLPIEGIDSSKTQYVICDLDFLSGKNFLAHARHWLASTKTHQKLYYYAIIETPLFSYQFEGDELALELQKKWPPVLAGMQFINFANKRIELVLWFGDRLTGLQELVCYHDSEKDKQLREWQVDKILVSRDIDIKLKLFIQQHFDKSALIDYQTLKRPENLKNSPWPFPDIKPTHTEKKMMIVGAGLAGSYLANMMAHEGWIVDVFEAENKCAQIGSGNAYSVLYPKLSLHQAPITTLMHQAYPYAYWAWREVIVQNPELGRCVPLLQVINDCSDAMRALILNSPDWFSIQENGKAIRFHNSLILNMPQTCEHLLMHPNIHCHYVNDIQDIQFLNDLWQINDIKAPVCVLANGYKLGQFRQTKGIELIGMRGQMTHIKTIHQEEIIYCAEGHFLPEWNGEHALGASFQNQFQDLVPCELDDEKNMRPWRDFFHHPQFEKVGDWVGIRGVSIDHIPLVGCVPKLDEFNEVFQDWRHHANKVMNSKMPNYPGLFVFAGFGSRGLLTIPLLAKILKNIMTKEPLLFSNHLLQALSPARFAKKNLSRK